MTQWERVSEIIDAATQELRLDNKSMMGADTYRHLEWLRDLAMMVDGLLARRKAASLDSYSAEEMEARMRERERPQMDVEPLEVLEP